MTNRLGGIADDFTGATDLAAALTTAGYRTVVTVGVPPADVPAADAVIVALKTRTAPVADAVCESLAAARWLRAAGATRIYFKYCSTFDSTPTGNIGPVADALLSELGLTLGVVVPSFPANGRRLYQATLFVHGQPLAESSMRHHPLTPMTDSNVVRLLEPQSTSRVVHVPLEQVRQPGELAASLRRAAADGPVLVVIDAIDDTDLTIIAEALPAETLLTGGAALAAVLDPPGTSVAGPIDFPDGPRLVVAGSASAATRAQVAAARDVLPSERLDVVALNRDPEAEVARLLDIVTASWARSDDPVLVYATATLDDLSDPTDRARDAGLIERGLAALCAAAVKHGGRRLIVAGGETSGAVTSELGVAHLEIGPSIAPGVVWSSAVTASGVRVALALKSGNFGTPTMFLDAWEVLG
jgi:uncharacterized protein YgbK (DUF1537 family)